MTAGRQSTQGRERSTHLPPEGFRDPSLGQLPSLISSQAVPQFPQTRSSPLKLSQEQGCGSISVPHSTDTAGGNRSFPQGSRTASSGQTLGTPSSPRGETRSIPGWYPAVGGGSRAGGLAGLGDVRRTAAAVPSTGIPHSCFLLFYLTGTSGGVGSGSPPPPLPELTPPSTGCSSHGLPQGQSPQVPPPSHCPPQAVTTAAPPCPVCTLGGVLSHTSPPRPFWGILSFRGGAGASYPRVTPTGPGLTGGGKAGYCHMTPPPTKA